MKYLHILIEESFLNNDYLTYSTENEDIYKGVRVAIFLRNRKMIGFVMEVVEPYETKFSVQPINEVIDNEPILDSELLDLSFWMSYQTVSPIIRCLQTILPNKLKPRSSFKNTKKVKRIEYITDKEIDVMTLKQKTFMGRVKNQALSLSEARSIYSGYHTLIEKGNIRIVEVESSYAESSVKKDYHELPLTNLQQTALGKIEFNSFDTYCLLGVTGSGKTEVYLHAAKKVLAEGKQVLIMVPEISLTPQMIERVSHRFGTDVTIYHSALNDQEKYEQYIRIKKGLSNIVVGTRSSVFLPFNNLGLIVMDEEHDSSYKQGNSPYYHARDIAIRRGEYHECPVVLGSASPSLETFARALKGNYKYLELSDRVNHSFPSVTTIDTNSAIKNNESPYLTNALKEGIKNRLSKKEQVVLLLNRRGYMTLLKNSKTNEVLLCKNCDVALNYHKKENIMKCHVCGETYRGLPSLDGEPAELLGSGVGTERFVEQLEVLYPNAVIGRMDADTTRKKGSHEKILREFINGNTDILVGTQMIAKGLDVENVTLVGIVNADSSLAYSDYRTVEQTFSMLLQAAGRSGRGSQKGEVIIQTSNPDHYAVQCAINHKYKHFFQQEMTYRKIANYPPYSYLISFEFSDESEEKVGNAAAFFMGLIESASYQIIGPTELRKMQKKYRVRILLKSSDFTGMLTLSNDAVKVYKKANRVGVNVDVNPISLE